MEYLNNSCDDKPRTAPVPASFSGGPIAPGVPEVSLVFSPLPVRREDLTHPPKTSISKTQVTNELNRGKNLNAHIDADVFNWSPLSLRGKERTSPSLQIQKSPIAQVGTRNFDSISEMANRIIRESVELEQQGCMQRNTNFQGNINNCVDHGMTQNTSGNSGKQFHMAGSCVSENGENFRQRYPDSYVSKSCSNSSGQLEEIPEHVALMNVNMPRNMSEQQSVIPCGSFSHHINKQCFCWKNSLSQTDARVTVPNNNTSPDHPCLGNGNYVTCSNSSKDCNFRLNCASPNTSYFKTPFGNSHPDTVQCAACLSMCSSSKMNKNWDNHHDVGINFNVSPNSVSNCSGACSNCVGIIHSGGVSETRTCDGNLTKNKNPESGCKGNFQVDFNRGTAINKESSGLKRIEEETINEEDNSSSNNSLLEKIVLMNEQQFAVLQGLLQQVVAMQGEQMKVLEEINKNLTPHQNSDKCLKTDVALPNIQAKNAFTQTNFTESTGDFKEDVKISVEDGPILKESPSKDSENSNELYNNGDSSPRDSSQSPRVMLVADKEKSKNLRDKAVSWSAIHGVETVEESITLHSVHVPTVEQMPSSVHTMHLHLQDYYSSASFESITENKQSSESRYSESSLDNKKSWTLYDNIVGHVKKFLQTVPCENNCGNISQKTSQVEAIRFATIEKIRQLGVSVYENSTEIKEVNTAGRNHFDPNLPHCQSPESSPFCTENNSDDASLDLQALALKYLPADELCELTNWNQGGRTNSILKSGPISNNISLATQNYLEKYHILPSFGEIKDKKQMCDDCNPVATGGNILDITTLKKQPKLL